MPLRWITDVSRKAVTLPLFTPRVLHFSSSVSSASSYDVAIIGGGIVGLSTARHLLLRRTNISSLSAPSPIRLVVIEKESSVGLHQSSHNSGVLHAGIYYSAGSLRAELSVEGIDRMYAYCREKGIEHGRVGKLIVATDKSELPSLDVIYVRGKANGVNGLTMVGSRRISEMEPSIVGIEAIWSPHTGIVRFHDVCGHFAADVERMGGNIIVDSEVVAAERDSQGRGWELKVKNNRRGNDGVVYCKHVILCGGLHSDRLSVMFGGPPSPPIVPFRGRWFHLKGEFSSIRSNIYPVPHPGFPFLGVHFTPLLDGGVLIGPTAALAFSREGYDYSKIDMGDLFRVLSLSEFRSLSRRQWRFGLSQWASELWPHIFLVPAIKKYMPSFQWSHMERAARDGRVRMTNGVRAQLLGENGQLIEDFLMEMIGQNVLSVRNAPSPAATASISIGERIAIKAEKSFGLS